jgi:hypothetical protein
MFLVSGPQRAPQPKSDDVEKDWKKRDFLDQGLGFREHLPKTKQRRALISIVGFCVGLLVLIANVVSKVRLF